MEYSNPISHRLRGILVFGLLLVWAWGSFGLAQETPVQIPQANGLGIQGGLDPWKKLPPVGHWNKDNIVYGGDNWAGPSDLGGTAWMGWDQRNLYIVADVADDKVIQKTSGESLWHGDHVMVLLNVRPDSKLPPTRFQAAGQFQIGLSPGSLTKGRDLLSNLPPEVYIWYPQYVGNSGIAVTAQKTDKGYLIQAALPWSFLGVTPHDGLKIDLDLCPSDCDTPDMVQQSLASLVPGKWEIITSRVIHAQLKGEPADAGPKIELARDEFQLQRGQSRDFTFDLPTQTDGLEPVVSLKARFAWPKLAGTSFGLVVQANGKPLEPDRCINRPHSVDFAGGYNQTLFQGNTWVLIYSPDYKAIHADEHSEYYVPPGAFDVYEYRFNVKDLLKPGKNTLTIRDNAYPDQKVPMALKEVSIQWLPPALAKKKESSEAVLPPVVVAPPKDLAPISNAKFDAGGAIRFQTAAGNWIINSQFSQPNGQWARLQAKRDPNWRNFRSLSPTHLQASTGQVALDRRILILGQCIEIHEKLTNLTDQKQPVMVRHQLSLPIDELAALTLNGRPMPMKQGITSDSMNPTLLLKTTQGSAVAMVPFDGVFRLHHQAYYLDNTAGLADSELVLSPRAAYEQVWQIYAVPSGDYWDLVNAIRKQWNNNFTLDGPSAFVAPRTYPGMQGNFNAQQMKQWFLKRNLRIPILSLYSPVTNGWEYGLATQFDGPTYEKVKRVVDVVHQADPALPVLRYYHCFITNGFATGQIDPADALVDVSGHSVVYSNDKERPIFIPTDTNRYGRQMTQLAQDLIHKFGYNGLYWDEQQYSYHLYDYGDRWDGVSGDIDRNTHQLVRTKSLVPLLSAGFRYNLMDWLAENHFLVTCNGQPSTPEDSKYKVHRFAETGSITNLYDTHLFSPVGLGDYLTERTSTDTVRSQIQFLNYGALYDYYESTIPVENPGLCRWMYPTTPIALGPGYLLAQERILTNRSGRFSWGTTSLPPLEVHEIDEQGNEVTPKFERIHQDGVEWLQLELPPHHAAAIVRTVSP